MRKDYFYSRLLTGLGLSVVFAFGLIGFQNCQKAQFRSLESKTDKTPLDPDPIAPIDPPPVPENDSWKNYYAISWIDTPENILKYAKHMGYEYIAVREWKQTDFKSSELAKGLKFYVTDPQLRAEVMDEYPGFERFKTPRYLDLTKTHSKKEIQWYNRYMVWKSREPFPANLASGWYNAVEINEKIIANPSVMWDFQQQEVIDYVVRKSLEYVRGFETKDFTFAGFMFDVPDLVGDFCLWDTDNSKWPDGRNVCNQTLAKLTGTGVDSGLSAGEIVAGHRIVHNFATYEDGRAAFLKQLVSEMRKEFPGSRWIIDPAHLYNTTNSGDEWLYRISKRSDGKELLADLMMEEDDSTQFVDLEKIFSPDFPLQISRNRVGSHQRYSHEEAVNRRIAGMAAKNGAWYNWFGRFSNAFNPPAGLTMPDFPSIDKVYPRLKLIRLVANWDNLNQTPFLERRWDATTGIYSSPNSYFSSHLIYSRRPKTDKIFVVFNDALEPLKLKSGTQIKEIQCADSYFGPSGSCRADFLITISPTGVPTLTLKNNVVLPKDSCGVKAKDDIDFEKELKNKGYTCAITPEQQSKLSYTWPEQIAMGKGYIITITDP